MIQLGRCRSRIARIARGPLDDPAIDTEREAVGGRTRVSFSVGTAHGVRMHMVGHLQNMRDGGFKIDTLDQNTCSGVVNQSPDTVKDFIVNGGHGVIGG